MFILCGDWKQVSKCENNDICGSFFFLQILNALRKVNFLCFSYENSSPHIVGEKKCVIIDYCSSNLSFEPSVYRISVHIYISFEMLYKKALEDLNDLYP